MRCLTVIISALLLASSTLLAVADPSEGSLSSRAQLTNHALEARQLLDRVVWTGGVNQVSAPVLHDCPVLTQMTFQNRRRPVLRTVHDGKIARCYYEVQWDKNRRFFAWSGFSDIPDSTFNGDVSTWRTLGMLAADFKVARGQPYQGNSFMVIEQETDLVDPEVYLESTKWTAKTVGDCRKHVESIAGLVWNLWHEEAMKGVTSRFDARYIWVNRSFTKAVHMGFNSPQTAHPSDAKALANAAKAAAQSLWNARGTCIVSQ